MMARRETQTDGPPEGARRRSISPAAMFADTRLRPCEQAMLACLGMYADTETGWCWPRQQTLSAVLGITRQAVGARLRALARYGWIEIEARTDPRTGAHTSARYRIVWEHQAPPEHRRTPPPELAVVTPQERLTPQPVLSPPATPAAGPRNPGSRPPQPVLSLLKEERPSRTTQSNDPVERERRAAVASPAPDAATGLKTSQRPEVPETVEPNAADLAVGAALGYTAADVAAMVPAMLDNWRVKGTSPDDWHAALRKWIRDEPKFGRRPLAGSAAPTPRSAAPPPRALPAPSTPAPLSRDLEWLLANDPVWGRDALT